jgi:DNA-binding response OmpR family regulator
MAIQPILLIDDERSWSEAIVSLLRMEGFDVLAAENGRRGLELLDCSFPQLVILDVHMAGLSGFEVLRELRQRTPYVPVLMVSSDDQAGPMAEALAEGATSFLRKPIAPELLLRAVRRLTMTSADRERMD